MWRVTFVMVGFLLAACQVIEPIEVTREQLSTAVPLSTSIPTTIAPTETLPPTHTPTATAVPTLVNTPTPVPTVTAVPSSTPTPAISPAIILADLDHLPTLPFDLLFMTGNFLKRWVHDSNQIETLLAEPIWPYYSLDAARQTILVARDLPVEPPAAELFLIEPSAGISRTLLSPISGLLDFALSPDGQVVAYTTGEVGATSGSVHLLAMDGRQQTVVSCQLIYAQDHGDFVHTSHVGCGTLRWSPDSQTVLWSDVAGVWEGGWRTEPRLLIANEWFADDAPRIYVPTQDWSLDGRYQLVIAHRGKGYSRRVYDRQTGTLIEVPHSITGLGETAYWRWTQDNRLFTVRPPAYFDDETENIAEIWHVEADELLLDESLVILSKEVGQPQRPIQLADGRFAFAFVSNDPLNPEWRGLYIISAMSEPPFKMNGLPPSRLFDHQLTWLPDGSAAIYHNLATNQILYVAMDGSPLIDVTAAFGPEVTGVTWLP